MQILLIKVVSLKCIFTEFAFFGRLSKIAPLREAPNAKVVVDERKVGGNGDTVGIACSELEKGKRFGLIYSLLLK